MYIVRWLTKHPIAGIWVLTITALFLSMSGGGSHKTEVASTDKAKEQPQQTELIVNKKAEGVTQTQNETKLTEGEAHTPSTSEVIVVTNTLNVPNTNAITSKVAEHNASAEGLDDQSTDDLLLMAREAYWNNGLDEAATIYQQLIQREPDVITHKGELGNVYWKQGFPEKSANLYAEISIPMIKNGNADRVSNMVGFIKLFHPNKAAEINKQLQGLTKD